MYCMNNISQSQARTGFLTGENHYMNYPPTSISQNMMTKTSYSSSTSSMGPGGQTIFSWAHTVPTYMPWAPKHEQANSEGLPPVVRFVAPAVAGPTDPCTSQTATTWELIHNLGNTCSGIHTANQHLKRRSDIDSDEEAAVRPVKQYISEERMAAKLSQMHISADNNCQLRKKCCDNSYKNTSKKSINAAWTTPAEDVSEESETDDGTSTGLEGSLVLSPELKKIIQPNPDLVKALLQERTKPSMALVLWQPPGGSVKEKIESQLQSSSTKLNVDYRSDNGNDNSSINNNNTLRRNLNIGTVPSFLPASSAIQHSSTSQLSTGKDFRLQFPTGVPCNNVLQCVDETDDMEL